MDHLPLLANVIEFYREPWHLHFKEWMQANRPLPRGTALLLELAAEDERVRRLGVAPEEFKEAQHFFIRQVLFAQGGDHYRTLGLADTASARDVRAHYRKLMRLFHPDLHPGEWYESYVTRLNEAYAVLIHADRRRSYDRERQAAAILRPSMRPTVGTAVEPRVLPRKRFTFQWRPRWPVFLVWLSAARCRALAFIRSYARPARLAGSLLSVLLAVLWLASQWSSVDFSRQSVTGAAVDSPAASVVKNTPSDSSEPSSRLSSQSVAVSIGDEVALFKGEEERHTAAAGKALSRAAVRSSPVAAQGDVAAESHVNAAVARTEGSMVQGKTAGAPVAHKPVEHSTPEPSALGTSQDVSTPLEVAGGAESSHPRVEELTADELATLLDRLAYAYRSGDMGAFLGLFANNAQIAQWSGREGMRREYAELFAGSTDRHFFLEDIRWRIGGTKARGTGAFRADLRRDGAVETYNGQLTLYVEKRPQGPLITEFYHDYGEPP